MGSWQSRVANGLLRLFVKRRFDPAWDLVACRERLQRIDRRLYGGAKAVRTERVKAGGVQCEWTGQGTPESSRLVLFLHGGGFFLRTPYLHARLASRIAAALGAVALIPDYRLAPESPFPAAPDDCFSVYKWLLDSGVTPERIAVAGDSAGGNLTLTTLMKARDAGLPLPACAICLSPGTDLSLGGYTLVSNERRDAMFRLQTLLIMKHAYLGGANPTDPVASPLFGDFRGLPPLLFQVGEPELLLDHSIRAYERARAVGVAAQLTVWRGMPHVFQAFAGLPEAGRAVAEIARFVARHADWQVPGYQSAPVMRA